MSKKKKSPRKSPAREDWYMGLAFWIASKSKDPQTQMGAIIVSDDNVIIGTGYNGPPSQCKDHNIDWGRPQKYDFVIHAEENAIIHAAAYYNLKGATVYVTGIPCKHCILKCASIKIDKVIYFPLKKDSGSMLEKDIDLIKEIAKVGDVKLEEFKGNLNWMRDRIQFMDEVLGIF